MVVSPRGTVWEVIPRQDSVSFEKMSVGWQEGCQGPFRPSGRNRGLPLRRRGGQGQERTGESGAFGLWPHPRGSSRISS